MGDDIPSGRGNQTTEDDVASSVSDAALLDVLTGRAAFAGKLPFELPSSMQSVDAQLSDVPHDSRNPLYPFGFGLRY